MSLARWWRQRRARLLQLWVVGLVAACAVTGASAMGYLESIQARALDLLIYLQSPRQPSGLVIVAIDDAAFDALDRRQPLPRDYLARVLRRATRARGRLAARWPAPSSNRSRAPGARWSSRARRCRGAARSPNLPSRAW